MKKISQIIAFFISLSVFSQTLSSVLEKKRVALGEVNTYKIRIDDLKGESIKIAPKNELLPFHFEEISDSVSVEGSVYERVIRFSIFDEGRFSIPEFEIKVGDKSLKTIAYEVEVTNMTQEGDEINDIMNNKAVTLDFQDYWEMYKWYILAFLGVLAAVFLAVQFMKYGIRKKSPPVLNTNQTLKELDLLRKKKYIENEDYRAFYVELIDICRSFITKQYHLPADVLLTDDLIALMKKNQTISQDNEMIVEQVFLRGDMVKFAKVFPNQEMMKQDFDNIRNFVKKSTKDLEFENLRKDV
ncbi:MAG: BatD family protein [Bergeyella zoohelcum]|nr:BatD family protein [Bergeyella zoohelcum]